ncbi:hypothetical protein IKP13_08770 [bacterium]|nr:hypothetical protein [bacterium]
MKKFLVLGLMLFSFSTVFADYAFSGKRMSCSAAINFCKARNMRMITSNEMPMRGGTYWVDGCSSICETIFCFDPSKKGNTAEAACIN